MPSHSLKIATGGAAAMALTIAGVMTADAAPRDHGWKKIATKTADFRKDVDVIPLDAWDGQLARFSLRIRRTRASIYRLSLVYEDGGTHGFGLPRKFHRPGSRTKAFLNPSPNRRVAYIEIRHRSIDPYGDGFDRAKAKVDIFAKRRHFQSWPDASENRRKLGSLIAHRKYHTVNLPVDLNKGRYSALRLHAPNRGVVVDSVEVTFGNGRTRHISDRRVIIGGATSPVIDLPGNRRFIQRVTVRLRKVRGLFKNINYGGYPQPTVLNVIGVR
ncbi:MAG: hypothetical protein AAF346_07565 [Pseudomonadota bacterium]